MNCGRYVDLLIVNDLWLILDVICVLLAGAASHPLFLVSLCKPNGGS